VLNEKERERERERERENVKEKYLLIKATNTYKIYKIYESKKTELF